MSVRCNKDILQPSGADDALETVRPSSHDSFDSSKHQNWLVNGAGLGAYTHGRIHQAAENSVFVGDLIHKRGPLKTDDVLLMEEQMLESTGAPLSTNSKLGRIRALEVLPSTGTVNGEGDLIGYYDHGAVAFNTFQTPRETRYTADGNIMQEGWDMKRMVAHVLNSISAVGRYAVAVLPRDHFFRSRFGLHFLKSASGEGIFADEPLVSISQSVSPILDSDDSNLLWGAACGHWLGGHRMMASTGMTYDNSISSSSFGRGFVVWNQASRFTEDRTPIPVWEGLWTFDSDVAGVHKFQKLPSSVGADYGFLCSTKDHMNYFASVEEGLEIDSRDGVKIPIEGEVVLGKWLFSGYEKSSALNNGRLEGVFSASSQRVKVWVRSDRKPKWALWRDVAPCEKEIHGKAKVLRNIPLGSPPAEYREATWFQFKVQSLGFMEIRTFAVDYSEFTDNTAKAYCMEQESENPDFFEFNSSPAETRWNA